MATEFLHEKISMLASMIQAESLQVFQSRTQVDTAAVSTGDARVDHALTEQATNAKAQILASTRRLETYRAAHAELSDELSRAA